jgi:hypothetical protein
VILQRIHERTIANLERSYRDLRPAVKKQIPRFIPMIEQLQEEPELLAFLIEEFYRKNLKKSKN